MQSTPPRLLLSRFLLSTGYKSSAPDRSLANYCRRQVKTSTLQSTSFRTSHLQRPKLVNAPRANRSTFTSTAVEALLGQHIKLCPELRMSGDWTAPKHLSMGRLKSNSGCRTCLARKKKCDEASPQCGDCERLDIVCVKRTDLVKGLPAIVTRTNLRGRMHGLTLPITNGYQPFASDLERKVSIGSCQVFAPFVSCMAGSDFASVDLLVNFCAQNLLVREAIMAFSAFTQAPVVGDPHKEALKSYQGCIVRLKQTRLDSQVGPTQACFILTAVCFLGLLEVSTTNSIPQTLTHQLRLTVSKSLGFGDPSNALVHFAMCKELLVSMLAKSKSSLDPNLTKLLRVVAECIMFNVATLSPFSARASELMLDWGSSFDRLFPANESASSPFLGGLQSIYRVMLRANVLLHRTVKDRSHLHEGKSDPREHLELWRQLNDLEGKVPQLYHERHLDAKSVELYKGKHKLAILALRIQLCKIARPLASPTDCDIRRYVSEAVTILEILDVRERGNPALRWPLTILACAAYEDRDFALLTAKMQDMQSVVDPANREKLSSAQAVMNRRQPGVAGVQSIPGRDQNRNCNVAQRIDLLLEPWKLLSLDSPFSWH